VISNHELEPDSPRTGVPVLVPAFNEAGSLVETIESLQAQTVAPTGIIVIDDFSDDGTGVLPGRSA
jgi:hypothetical protein